MFCSFVRSQGQTRHKCCYLLCCYICIQTPFFAIHNFLHLDFIQAPSVPLNRLYVCMYVCMYMCVCLSQCERVCVEVLAILEILFRASKISDDTYLLLSDDLKGGRNRARVEKYARVRCICFDNCDVWFFAVVFLLL